jgi:hypothetical protein
MIEKARRAAAFLFWYSQTSLPEVRFVLILHAWTKLSFSLCKHVFFFFFFVGVFLLLFFFYFKKKRVGEKDANIYFSFNFSDILCIFT